jgi:hypothetical protein
LNGTVGTPEAAATWTAADTWRGLLSQPKSLSRYVFVESSPITHVDVGGHRIGDPSAYNTNSAAQAAAMREVDNVIDSRDWQGRESPGIGTTSGAGLGCSGLIMWFW